jgi:hypothetical protein
MYYFRNLFHYFIVNTLTVLDLQCIHSNDRLKFKEMNQYLETGITDVSQAKETISS